MQKRLEKNRKAWDGMIAGCSPELKLGLTVEVGLIRLWISDIEFIRWEKNRRALGRDFISKCEFSFQARNAIINVDQQLSSFFIPIART